MTLFTEPAERAKAMGVFGFVAAGGGSVGVLLGGVLTDRLDWHWIFLVNLPVGALVFALCLALLPAARERAAGGRLDIAGAATATGSLMLAVYAIVNGSQAGWTSGETLGLLAGAAALLGLFLLLEARVASPLVPLALFRLRNVATANAVGVLWAAAMFAWFFLSALYLQRVLGYSPLEVGLAFLPTSLIMGAFSLGLSAKLVMRFGIRRPLATGLSLGALGLLLFVRAPVDGSFAPDVLPSMILLGCGAGMAFNPLLLAAMSDVAPKDAGLASGVVNTAFMMGGALGLAILASLADQRTNSLLAGGDEPLAALVGGYHVAFLAGAVFAGAAGGGRGAAPARRPVAGSRGLRDRRARVRRGRRRQLSAAATLGRTPSRSRKQRAAALGVLGADLAAVRLGDLPDDREAEPRAGHAPGGARAVEAVEHVREVLGPSIPGP